jgi:hypothetical protein
VLCLYLMWQNTTRVAYFPLPSTLSAPVPAPGRALQVRSFCVQHSAVLLGPCTALTHCALRNLA